MGDFCIRIGGEAGQGLRSVGSLLSKALQAKGYHIFSNQDYESRVRGGHNFYNIRFSDQPLYTHTDRVDILVALDKETTELHMDNLSQHGIAVFDPGIKGIECPDPDHCFAVPFTEIAEKHGSKIMANTAAAATIWGLLKGDFSVVKQLLEDVFEDKDQKIIDSNTAVAEEAYKLATEGWDVKLEVPKAPGNAQQILINGNSSIAVGAIASGLKFMSAYPMSPSTSVTEYVATQGKNFNIVMEQAEDEIAAIVMAIGASYAGARSMTATSGGGLALMGEAVSMAGMNETSVVIIDAQRPGPATGLPTRTAQEDLLFSIYLGHGEFPKVVLAPGIHEEAFSLTTEAFNYADRYQCPVIVLTDEYMADAQKTVAPFDFQSIKRDRGELVTSDQEAGSDYKRYEITDSGISKRMVPGLGKSLVVSCTDEHNEEGHLIEDAHIRNEQMQKRMKKFELARQEMPAPKVYGDPTADTALVCWGTTYGSVREAIDILSSQGKRYKMVHFTHVWPLNVEKIQQAIGNAKNLICLEQNFTGQFAKLLQAEANIKCTRSILKYDGRPMSPEYIVEQLRGDS